MKGRSAAIALLLVACDGDPLASPNPEPPGPLYERLDATHPEGDPGFLWLPPVAVNVPNGGTFNPTVVEDLAVEICIWAGTCQQVIHSVVGSTTGAVDEAIRVNAEMEFYTTEWVSEAALDVGTVLRITASLHGSPLGHMDLGVVESITGAREARSAGLTPYEPGTRQTIRFRIDEGVFEGAHNPNQGMRIADGRDPDGEPGFYFVPPTRVAPDVTPTFDLDLLDRLTAEVCELLENGCGAIVQRFGPGRTPIERNESVPFYQATWPTVGVDPTRNYRMRVFLDGELQGYADIDLRPGSVPVGVSDGSRAVMRRVGEEVQVRFVFSSDRPGKPDPVAFLPPLGPDVDPEGVFDPSVHGDLRVQVLQWQDNVCDARELATFTADGPSTARLRLEDDRYAVLWNTSEVRPADGRQFRIRVLAGERELGYADAELTSTGVKAHSSGALGLVSSYPEEIEIGFRVFEGALERGPLRWELVRRMPLSLRGVSATSDGICIYAFGGNGRNRGVGGWVDLTQIYDPSSDRWMEGTPFPIPRDFAMSAVLPDGIHLIGGSRMGTAGEPSNVLIADHRVYDRVRRQWFARAPLPIAIDAAVVHEVDELLYVVGGGSPGGFIHGMVLIYDWLSDTWSDGTPMPTPRHTAASAVIDGKIHVVGGSQLVEPSRVTHQRYDPGSDSWEELAPLPFPRAGLGGGTILGGGAMEEHFCVFGGVTGRLGAPGLAETFCYDPETDSWADAPDMLTARGHPGFVTHGDAIYAIGGFTDESEVVGTVERLVR